MFAESFSQLRRVTLPKEYHLGHKMFNKEISPSESGSIEGYREEDLELYEGIHNSKIITAHS